MCFLVLGEGGGGGGGGGGRREEKEEEEEEKELVDVHNITEKCEEKRNKIMKTLLKTSLLNVILVFIFSFTSFN